MQKLTFLALFVFMGLFARAFDVPPLVSGVNDGAHIIDEDVANQLSNALIQIYQKGGPQLAVVTIPSLDDAPIEDVAIKIARSWKLGKERVSNGILVLIAPKERKVRIEVGQGMEGDLTDAYSRRIIDDIMIPEFRKGGYSSGTILGVGAILRRMNPPVELQDYLQMPEHHQQDHGIDWIHLLIMFIIIIVLISSRGGGGGLMWFLLGSAMGGGGRSGGSSWGGGGGGGWSGGGGGFSGGGSSGSW